MKDERTLADRLEAGSARVGEGLCHFHDVEGAEESFAGIASLLHEAAQALRSQPSVEEVGKIVWVAFTGNPNIWPRTTEANETVRGCMEAARQITALYKGEGDDRP